ncbi:MAG: sigma-54-dependent Fis family transcriptional regulator [Acidobacteria bacterium]|nr:sigma-54-dependent Fis family transcriptional regulator [Acidobacteriota bacterium]
MMLEHQTYGERHVLVGESARIRHVRQMIDKVSRGDWPVLLLGETGAGKEVIARAIHTQRNVGPFVTIDCSALVGPLVESELFGHVKGAFTGAMGQKTGLLEMADGGTAFLDEIGELPMEMQAKLLRVLQEKEFRPVGSTQTRRSKFRVIAATNRDLAKEVERGTFRRDLYYRLNVLPIRIPPLRDRRDDIPLLINHFLRRENMQNEIAVETMTAMLSYEWPGNVRELENCIHHMVALNVNRQVQMYDLPSAVQNHAYNRGSLAMGAAAGATGSNGGGQVAAPLRMPMGIASQATATTAAGAPIACPPIDPNAPVIPLVDVERRAILHALEHTGGDRNIAANLLGIGRTTLYRKLKEYRLVAV